MPVGEAKKRSHSAGFCTIKLCEMLGALAVNLSLLRFFIKSVKFYWVIGETFPKYLENSNLAPSTMNYF